MPCIKGSHGPSFIDKWTFILQYAFSPCTTPWTVYAKTGGRALGNAALALVGTSWDDVARSLFRPKGQRILAHGGDWKRNRKRGSEKALLTDTAELVGGGIELLTDWKPPTYQQDDVLLWHLDSFVQHQLYKVVIVGTVTDTAYDWFSGILEAPQSDCTEPHMTATLPAKAVEIRGPVEFLYNFQDQTVVGIIATQWGYFVPEGRWIVTYKTEVHNTTPANWTSASAAIYTGPANLETYCSGPVSQTIKAHSSQELTAVVQVEGPDMVYFANQAFPPTGCGYGAATKSIIPI